MENESFLTAEQAEGMGISQPAFEEVQNIIGRMPTVAELSTLLAMWDANGRQQSLYAWLKGQHHQVERNEYLYTGSDTTHRDIREPRIRDCVSIAHSLDLDPDADGAMGGFARGENLYMVGNVSTGFLDSEYARRCLHIVADPVRMTTPCEDMEYYQLILASLYDAGIITSLRPVRRGGLFAALAAGCFRIQDSPTPGFDILTCREIRLDAFLFGEEEGRYVVSLAEKDDDLFLAKMADARVNCCFLGHATKGRVLIDDYDFGDIRDFVPVSR